MKYFSNVFLIEACLNRKGSLVYNRTKKTYKDVSRDDHSKMYFLKYKKGTDKYFKIFPSKQSFYRNSIILFSLHSYFILFFIMFFDINDLHLFIYTVKLMCGYCCLVDIIVLNFKRDKEICPLIFQSE